MIRSKLSKEDIRLQTSKLRLQILILFGNSVDLLLNSPIAQSRTNCEIIIVEFLYNDSFTTGSKRLKTGTPQITQNRWTDGLRMLLTFIYTPLQIQEYTQVTQDKPFCVGTLKGISGFSAGYVHVGVTI